MRPLNAEPRYLHYRGAARPFGDVDQHGSAEPGILPGQDGAAARESAPEAAQPVYGRDSQPYYGQPDEEEEAQASTAQDSVSQQGPQRPRSFGGQPGGMSPMFWQSGRGSRYRDRAPSRLAFRLERLWLTPAFRSLARIGGPILLVGLIAAIWLGNADRRAQLVGVYEGVKTSIQNRPEFMIDKLDITGAGPEVAAAVRMMLPVKLPASRFAIDLTAYRDAIGRLDAVKDVALVARSGGALEVKIVEREPVLLWRTPSGVEMLDETGHRVASLTRRDARPDLALIAGDGAENAVPEALSILAEARPILPRARGLVRMGERRWDLVLAGGRRIELPEKDPQKAMERVLALDSAEDLLSRDFIRIDMRDRERPTIRLSEHALEQMEVTKGQPVHKPAASDKVVSDTADKADAGKVAPGAAAKTAPPAVKPAASVPAAKVKTAATPVPAPRPAAVKADTAKTGTSKTAPAVKPAVVKPVTEKASATAVTASIRPPSRPGG